MNSIFPSITAELLHFRLHHSDGSTLLIDTRPGSDYGKSHICGSISLPLQSGNEQQFLANIRELTPENRRSVFIIADSMPSALKASRLLEATGYLVPVVLEGGFEQWLSSGYCLETPSENTESSTRSLKTNAESGGLSDHAQSTAKVKPYRNWRAPKTLPNADQFRSV